MIRVNQFSTKGGPVDAMNLGLSTALPVPLYKQAEFILGSIKIYLYFLL